MHLPAKDQVTPGYLIPFVPHFDDGIGLFVLIPENHPLINTFTKHASTFAHCILLLYNTQILLDSM